MATNWDPAKPAGADKIRLSDELIRANNAALEDAIGRNHNFPGNEGTDAGEHTIVEIQERADDPSTPTDVITIYNKVNVPYVRLQNDGAVHPIISPIPSGTKMYFKQNSAPNGWTFSASHSDKVLINTTTEAQGGTTGGSWTLSGITVDNHVLTIAEMPAHSHGSDIWVYKDQGNGTLIQPGTNYKNKALPSEGGGQGHNHGLSFGSSWRPACTYVITCIKD